MLLVQLALLLAWLLECGQIPTVVGGDGGPRSLASLFLVFLPRLLCVRRVAPRYLASLG